MRTIKNSSKMYPWYLVLKIIELMMIPKLIIGLEDISIFRAVPNSIVLYPADVISTEIAVKLVLGWSWFIYSVIFTLKNYPEKRKFYITFIIYFSFW